MILKGQFSNFHPYEIDIDSHPPLSNPNMKDMHIVAKYYVSWHL